MHIVAANQHPSNSPWRYVTICLGLALIFFTVLLLVVMVPITSKLDMQLSQSLQTLRNPQLDQLMVGITMSADFVVTTSIIAALIVLLLVAQRWWLAIHLACVYSAAKLGVLVIKLSIARARPEMLEGTLEFFSFPSGHACAAAVVCGVVSAMISYQRPIRVQSLIYGLGIVMALLVSVSRVYLLAHWPTDVLAGLLFGYILVVAFIWQLHSGVMLSINRVTPLLLTVCILSIGTYLYFTFSAQAALYEVSLSF